MSVIDINLSAYKWVSQHDGIDVTFFKLKMPESKTFNGKWIAWFECDLFDYQPNEYDSEPSISDVESLYTG